MDYIYGNLFWLCITPILYFNSAKAGRKSCLLYTLNILNVFYSIFLCLRLKILISGNIKAHKFSCLLHMLLLFLNLLFCNFIVAASSDGKSWRSVGFFWSILSCRLDWSQKSSQTCITWSRAERWSSCPRCLSFVLNFGPSIFSFIC